MIHSYSVYPLEKHCALLKDILALICVEVSGCVCMFDLL